MAHDFSLEERVNASLILQERMLAMLWVYVLGKEKEPVEEARAVEYLLTSELEEIAFETEGRSAARMQQLLIEPLASLWEAIIGELEESGRPVPYTPTEYGKRIADLLRGGRPPQAPDDAPDQ
ncbi:MULTISPECIES: hypothetical protein [Sphingomonas]|uniref:Uncharacterized protein n=1 Tax=Sphingomonas molluscorum TaxID=418184 RepID=A0ABU8Q7M4_9SPHN|nr:hypothetical protein [Sphingomonas sp. JUb134]MBM7407084.1 hypothetical protein [Sphingomonas sp. JUb134]